MGYIYDSYKLIKQSRKEEEKKCNEGDKRTKREESEQLCVHVNQQERGTKI